MPDRRDHPDHPEQPPPPSDPTSTNALPPDVQREIARDTVKVTGRETRRPGPLSQCLKRKPRMGYYEPDARLAG